MNIRIKKWAVFGSLGLVSISTGIFLFIVLIEALGKYGFQGYLALGIFIISFVLYIAYERKVRQKYKIVDEALEEVAKEYDKKPVNLGSMTSIQDVKSELRTHLRSKVANESYTLFGMNK